MPTLADLWDMGKRYVKDALPGGSLNPEVTRQGVLDAAAISTTPVPVLGDLVGLGADVHRYATEPESRTAGNFALSGLGLLPFVPAMTAWHGSPHKFDKFSLDKIGTGEGAQAYGHGLYLAEKPEVAKEYSKMTPELDALYSQRGSLRASRKPVPPELDAAIQKAESSAQGQLYKTDIPDEAVARFLDWDKPLSQQAPEVQAALANTKNKQLRAIVDYASSPYSTPGLEGEVKTMGEAIKLLGMNASPAKGSALLAKQGIPGIRYLDQGSRSAGQGSSNFVIFDPELIRILERNGQATGNVPWKPGEYRPLNDLMNVRKD